MITGLMNFKENKCLFYLYEDTFKLEIQSIDNQNKDQNFRRIAQFKDNREYDIILEGNIHKSGKNIKFHIKQLNMPTLDVYKADLHSYVVYKNEIEECDTLRFIGKEFNWFYSLSEAYDNVHFEESGKSHFTIKDYDSTWDQFDFKYKDSKVKGIFDIARYYPDNFSAPIILSSTFILNFEEIIEIAEIKNVSFSVGDFLRFITYRNNYYFQNVELLKKENNSDTYKVVGRFMSTNIVLYRKRHMKVLMFVS